MALPVDRKPAVLAARVAATEERALEARSSRLTAPLGGEGEVAVAPPSSAVGGLAAHFPTPFTYVCSNSELERSY